MKSIRSLIISAVLILGIAQSVLGFGQPATFTYASCSIAKLIDRTNICQGDQLNFGAIDTSYSPPATMQIPYTNKNSDFPYLLITPTTVGGNLGTLSVPIQVGYNKAYLIQEMAIRWGTDHTFNNQDPSIQAVVQAEIQLYLSPQDGVGNNAGVAWLIGNGDPVLRPGYSNGLINKILSNFVNNSQSINQTLPADFNLGNYVNVWLQPNPNFSRNTRFFKYTATRTYQSPTSGTTGTCEAIDWYVFDLPILVPGSDLANLKSTVFKNPNANFTNNSTATVSILATGCWPTSFFQNKTRYNTGFWAVIVFVLLYFVQALYSEKDLQHVDETFKDNAWTLFPMYSIWTTGGDHFTKNARLCVWWVTLGAQMTFQMIFFVNLKDKIVTAENGGFIVYAAFANVASWPINYIAGAFFSYNQGLQREKYIGLKKGEIDVQINTAWFIFYFPCYAALAFAVVITAWQGSYQTTAEGAWWLLGLLIGFGIDCILDLLIVGVAKCAPGTISWWKKRGYWFDYELYMAVKKYEHID